MTIKLLRLFLTLVVLFSLPSLHAQSISELNHRVDSLIQASAYDKAFPLSKSTLKRAEQELEKADTNYVNALSNLGGVYFGQGQLKQADSVWKQSRLSIETILGKQSIQYAGILANLGATYNQLSRYKEADTLLREALQIEKTVIPKRHPLRASTLDELASVYTKMGRFLIADSLFKEALPIVIDLYGNEHPKYANVLNNMGNLYGTMARFDRMADMARQALPIYRRHLQTQYGPYSNALNNLASAYSSTGQYEAAEPYFKEAVALAEHKFGKVHPDYAIFLHNLGINYSRMGRFDAAENAYNEAMQIRQRILGKKHQSYSRSLNSLANLYTVMGQYQRAEALLLEALQIREQVYGKKNPNYALALMSLATVYKQSRRFEKADSLYLQAKEIYSKTQGKQHVDYGHVLQTQGQLYLQQGKYEQAQQQFQEAELIYQKTLGSQNFSYATTLEGQGSVAARLKQFSTSFAFYKQALAIYEHTAGRNHPAYLGAQTVFIDAAIKSGQLLTADSLYKTAYVGELTFSQQLSRFLAESENQKAQQQFSQFSARLASFYSQNLTNYPNASEILFNNTLYQKGNQLQNLTQLRQRVSASQDTSLINLFDRWTKRKRLLAFYHQNPAQTKYINLADEQDRANQLEKELLQRSQPFRLANEQNTVRWQDVQKQLKPGEAAVEFIHFPYYNGIDETDTIRYMALVVRPGDVHPTLVRLFNESSLDSLLHGAGTTAERISQLYKPGSKQGRELYRLVWQPLAPLLTKSQTVYVSPSGLLNRVSLGAIPTPTGQFLADRYEIRHRMSLRELATPTADTRLAKNSRAVLYGGIQYETDSLALRQAIPLKTTQPIAYRRSMDSTRGGSWGTLPATLTEAKTIDQLLRTNAIRTELRTGWQANEESVKALENGQSPEVIHLATHGFFYPEPLQSDKNTFKSAENPLLRSGLVLAGANRVWRGGKPIDGLEDGILTAYEVANLNLSNTQLVTLSACETGLGDIRGAEGVYGLQRAFRLAGVPTILVSLWRIPDKETAQMMQLFYGNFARGLPAETAFRQAQQTMRQRYSPYYWGAFVLIR